MVHGFQVFAMYSWNLERSSQIYFDIGDWKKMRFKKSF